MMLGTGARYNAVAIDGIDGAGKTTVATALRASLETRGGKVDSADRSGPAASPAVAALTTMIKASDGGIQPLTEAGDGLVRLARAWERWRQAESSSALTLLDRWLITDLSRLSESTFRSQKSLITELVHTTESVCTILLEAPFELTWGRVMDRPEHELSPKEQLGRSHNEALHRRVVEIGLERFDECGGDAVRIENTGSIEDVVSRVLSHLGIPDRDT